MSKTITNNPKEINFKALMPLAMLHLMIYLAAVSVAFKMVQIGPFIF